MVDILLFQSLIRPRFYANAGSNQYHHNATNIILDAETVNESVVYQWEDLTTSEIYTGKTLNILVEESTTFSLKVQATSDLYVDYDTVAININEYDLISIAPNPGSSLTTVNYDAYPSINSSIQIFNINNPNYSLSQILNPSLTSTSVDVSNLPSGNYLIVLVCDGILIESKNFLKL